MKDRIKVWWMRFKWFFVPPIVKRLNREMGELKGRFFILITEVDYLERRHQNLVKSISKKKKLIVNSLADELDIFGVRIKKDIDSIRKDLDGQIEYNREIDRKVGELNASAGRVMSQAFHGR